MNETKKKYQKKCKSKVITFYLHEQDLLDYANTLNFQKCVKNWLKLSMTMEELNRQVNEAYKERLERNNNDANKDL